MVFCGVIKGGAHGYGGRPSPLVLRLLGDSFVESILRGFANVALLTVITYLLTFWLHILHTDVTIALQNHFRLGLVHSHLNEIHLWHLAQLHALGADLLQRKNFIGGGVRLLLLDTRCQGRS